MPENSNIILIGMPGSGKSTVGVILAKMASYDFLDTDLMIQNSRHRSLQEIIDCEGFMALRKFEEQVLLSVTGTNTVIATGGSAVYSTPAMDHLHSIGTLVFLDANMHTLVKRVNDFETRGLAKRPDQTFEELYSERVPLYQKHADITLKCDSLSHEQVAEKIIAALKEYRP